MAVISSKSVNTFFVYFFLASRSAALCLEHLRAQDSSLGSFSTHAYISSG